MSIKNFVGFTFLLSVLFCCFASCDDDDDAWDETITIKPYKSTYHPGGNRPDGEVPCYVAYNSKNEKLIIEHIDGFDELFKEGMRYTLRVNITYHKGSQMADDLPYYSYKLVKILKEEPVSDEE